MSAQHIDDFIRALNTMPIVSFHQDNKIFKNRKNITAEGYNYFEGSHLINNLLVTNQKGFEIKNITDRDLFKLYPIGCRF